MHPYNNFHRSKWHDILEVKAHRGELHLLYSQTEALLSITQHMGGVLGEYALDLFDSCCIQVLSLVVKVIEKWVYLKGKCITGIAKLVNDHASFYSLRVFHKRWICSEWYTELKCNFERLAMSKNSKLLMSYFPNMTDLLHVEWV